MLNKKLALFIAAAVASAAAAQSTLRSQFVADGFIKPLWVTAPPADTSRLFIVEQRNDAVPPVGFVRILSRATNQVLPEPFWTSPPVADGNSEGVLCLVFHPTHTNKCYVSYTQQVERRTIISELTIDPTNQNRVLEGSERLILRLWAPSNKHNGGWMAFSNDETGPALYIALGDDANPIVAQDFTDELRGKIIRIDVDGPDNIPGNADDDAFPSDTERNYSIPPLNPFVGTTGDDEIIAYGLRSPWRPHLDASGRLYVADAGEIDREEMSIVDLYRWPANFGWVCTEGTLITNDPRCFPGPHPITLPSIEYTNINNNQPAIPPTNIRGCAIVGGPTLPSTFGRCLQGQYLFADYCTGDIFSARFDSFGALTQLTNRTQQLNPGNNRSISWISSFGQTQTDVFVCDSVDGEIFQILPDSLTDACPHWCNDIDFDNNASIFDPQDIESFLLVYSEGPCQTSIPAVGCDSIDFNNDASIFDPQDIEAFLSVYSEGPCI